MADINNLSVLPRPRTAWQALDAGFSLARAHYIKLVILWLGFSTPIFLFCVFVQFYTGLTVVWSIMFFFWWWFKPFYELPIFMYLSRALFSEQLSLTAAWKMALSQFWLMCKTYLTIARFSSARSLTFGVVFLEKLPHKQRRKRINTLTMVRTRHYLLMLACLHIEYVLAYGGLLILTVIFAPNIIDLTIITEYFVEQADNQTPSWYWAITFAYFFAAGLIAPFYTSSGFLIYINRRMDLEAWDIEHRFRSIKPRQLSTVSILLLAVLAAGVPEQSQAQERAESLMPIGEVPSAVQLILDHKDFGELKTRKFPTFDFDKKEEKKRMRSASGTLANAIKIALWVVIALFVVLLIYTLRRFRRPSFTTNPLTRNTDSDANAISHPLTQDLPSNIASAAQQMLREGNRRQALSILFRGALRSIMTEHGMTISKGATESDCKQRIFEVASDTQKSTFSSLLNVWQKEAYANQPQQDQVIAGLINDWTTAFAKPTSQFSGDEGKRS